MTLTLRLSEEDERRLAERDIRIPSSIAEILATVRRQFKESGLTDDDLDDLVRDAREEVWHEKTTRTSRGE